MDTHRSENEESGQSGGIKSDLQEILSELRGHKRDLDCLKEEVRGNALTVKEVKKLKTAQDINWRFQGNKTQFMFNTDIEDSLKQSLWALQNDKVGYCRDLIQEASEKLKVRNKHIRIADSSEGGWETVRQYESHPLASDSEDESRINRAESRAVRKRKSSQKSKPKSRASAAFGFSDSVAMGRAFGGHAMSTGGAQPMQQPLGLRPGAFRGYPASTASTVGFRGNFQPGPCFSCGETTHFRRNCPYTRSQQAEVPNRK